MPQGSAPSPPCRWLPPPVSPLAWAAGWRCAMALLAVAVLWLAVAWALDG